MCSIRKHTCDEHTKYAHRLAPLKGAHKNETDIWFSESVKLFHLQWLIEIARPIGEFQHFSNRQHIFSFVTIVDICDYDVIVRIAVK